MRPVHLPRSAGGKTSPTTVKALDIRNPAPPPCTPLDRISWTIFCEMPDRTEPARKISIPAMNSGLRPYISETRPTMGTRVVGHHQVGGHHPGDLVYATHVGDDPGQGGCDDGLVEGGQEQGHHGCAQDQDDLGPGKSSYGAGGIGGRFRGRFVGLKTGLLCFFQGYGTGVDGARLCAGERGLS